MGQKRILIVSQYSLFDQGLRAALSQQPDVEVVGVYRDLEAAYVEAQSLRPDVLLLIAGPEIVRESAFRLLEEISSSIIRISPTDASMQMYRREQVDQATLEDLMTAIQMTAIQWKTGGRPDLASRQMASKPGGYPTRRRRDSMKHFIAVAILVAIVTALVTVGLGSIHLLPPLASEQGVLVDGLFGLHIRVIAFLFSLIVVITLYSIVAFRRKPGDTEDGLHIEGNTALEIAWTIIPLGTVLFFATLGARQLSQITAPSPDEMVIEVTAQQFAWRFDYPDYGITTADMHMVQHLLLVMIAPPLLLIANPFPFFMWGLPAGARRAVGRLFNRRSSFRRSLRSLTSPGLIWMVFVALFLGWHDPNAYNAALRNDLVHDLEHLTFFGSALLFWWHVIGAGPRLRSLSRGLRLAYLLATLPVTMAAGIAISFASQPIYTCYTTVPRPWGLTVMQDQMLGGVIMWVPGSMMYLLAALILISRLIQSEADKPPLPESEWATDEAMIAPGWKI